MLGSFNLDKTYNLLLVALAFLMPLTVFGANLIIVIICLIWLFSGNYKYKINQIINSKFLLASILFFSIHVVGLLWTDDISWGLHIVHKMWYFLLLLPVLFTIVKSNNIKLYVSAFLIAITISEILSYLVWFEVIGAFKNATPYNPTPFMSHVSYNPILAFAIYLVGYELLNTPKMHIFKRCMFGFFMMTMSINMFITGGRAGQVMFFAMLSILIFQWFNTQKLKAILLILIVIPSIFFTAYQSSPLFHERVDATIYNLVNFADNKGSSVGLRLVFAINSWEVIVKNPIFGIGTGDFPSEYKKINQVNTPNLPNATNPHNMYVLILMQLGLVGLISFFSVIYYQIKFSLKSNDVFVRKVGLTLPLLFLLIMWSDSYLLGHFTTLVFVFFSSFLYKDFEKS